MQARQAAELRARSRSRGQCTDAAVDLPDRLRPLSRSLSLTSSHSAARRTRRFRHGRPAPISAISRIARCRRRHCRRSTSGTASASGRPCRSSPAAGVDVETRPQNVGAVEIHLAGRDLARIELIDPVQDAQQRGFSAPRRSDEGGDAPVIEWQADVVQRLKLAIEEIHVPDIDFGGRHRRVGCLIRGR